MSVKDAVVIRFQGLCAEKGIRLNELATRSGVAPSSVYSMVNPQRREISITLIKKLCDGLEISLGAFFNDEIFEKLEQEIM